MSKNILVLSQKNSSRSIIVEAVINKYINDVDAQSAGIKASGKLNPNTKKVLQEDNSWKDTYNSKALSKVIDQHFDLVITVCDEANKNCPTFAPINSEDKIDTKVIHIGYEDVDKKNFSSFEKLLKQIKMEIIPIIRFELFE